MSKKFKLIFYLDNTLFSYSHFNLENNCFEKINKHNIDFKKNDFNNEIHQLINNEKYFHNHYTEVSGVVDTKFCTLIPESLFDKKNIKEYLDFTTNPSKHTTYLYTKQQFTNCYSIFSIKTQLMKILSDRFHQLKLKTYSSVFIDYTLKLSSKNSQAFFIWLDKKKFHISFIKNKNLLFYNQFRFKVKSDFLYHLLNCIHVLDLDPTSINLNIITNLEKNNKLVTELNDYIKHINFIERPSEFIYSNSILNEETHINQNIFSQLICE